MKNVRPYLLLVEDDHEDALFFKETFRQHYPQIDVLHFADSMEVVRFLTCCPPGAEPALLLLDYKMHSANAPELLRLLRKHEEKYTHLRKAVWSTAGRLEEEQTCKALGVNFFYKKPVIQNEWQHFVKDIGRHIDA